ncbi:FtsK/SpoIIIE domain-containing protein [Isoptericola sp. b490]|uniref:FtsK/SpoIIIE domain-containing protein n=1 Tax=Actinotalea lenta TaxID=3064654 RepID=UPI0027132D11|nr:FtsK/SpoIIIE domain-containing protein [Isoptericola sp. b490]MDO8119946.1 FtsK/SpoIIIE domain-containing protein [Isoptericola sp. b490]
MLGIANGWLGTAILLARVQTVALVVPWRDLGLVLAVALAAGLLASVLPARSAARTPPVEALGTQEATRPRIHPVGTRPQHAGPVQGARRRGGHPARMRFTLEPGGDVHVPDGVALGACRPGLVELVGSTALAEAPLSVAGRPLTEDQLAGVAPWVEGSRVAVAAGTAPAPGPLRSGSRAGRWQVAVTAGPDVGSCAAARGRVPAVRVGSADGSDLRLTDAAVLARHGTLHRVLGRWWWRERRRWAVPRPVRTTGVRVGGCTLVPARPGEDARVPSRGPVWAWLTPAAGGVAMAVALRTPALALLALAALLPMLGRLRPVRRPLPWGPDPAESVVLATTCGEREVAWWASARGGVALVGARAAALDAARALVAAALLDPGLEVVLVTDRSTDWTWCRWSPRVRVGLPRTALRRALVVVDGGSGTAVQQWWRRQDDVGVLLLAGDTHQVPAWCRHVLAATDPRLPRAGSPWAEAVARTLAGHARPGDDLPRAVSLTGLLRRPASGGVLTVPLGLGPRGVVDLDLIADGPHLLVAGTTGAGKSELLRSLVLALAARYPPSRVALVLVDFKGGAGLGACHRLPHVAGTVTDLDAHAAARALAGVRAELRRRERLLAAAGCADLEDLRARGPAPPRLVVVVDELLALREDLPDVLPALIRLASQGRSLGIHLVLATQRPAGALDAQVRANVPLRVCLRVAEAHDSVDVLGTPEAATIPADLPGRALLRRADLPVERVQTAWAALPAEHDGPVWAPAWPPRPAPGTVDDPAGALVGAVSRSSPTPLWRPALPDRCDVDDLERLVGGVDDDPGSEASPRGLRAWSASPLRLGLVDLPDTRRTDPLTWDLGRGPLVLAGPGGSGRTTALRTVAQVALRAGLTVHVLHAAGWSWPRGAPGGQGTVVGADDPRRALRLLELLAEGPGRRDVLLVDDVGAVLAALARLPRGAGDRALVDLAATTVPVACAGHARDVRGLDGNRVRLGAAPPGGANPGAAAPGRGVRESDGAVCHVAVPVAGPARAAGPPADLPRSAPLRLAPLPRHVDGLGPWRGAWGAPLGRGGDDARELVADLGRGLLVCGPARSGRSAALARLAAGAPQGVDVLVAAPSDLDHAVGRWARSSGGRRLFVVDDADLALRGRPDVEDRLVEWVLAAEAGDAGVPRVAVAARTDRAAGTFRGLVAALRGAASVVLVDPMTPGSSEVAGFDLARVSDPRRVPGRGALVEAGVATPLQLAGPCAPAVAP